ncbi:MAG: DHH family phosphoesterase [Thermoplasmata archaeon]|nr:DHH family phosphoesterase [Thermoplasmata archaeon]
MPASAGDPRRMARDLAAAARVIRDAKTVRVVTHIDADGISAGAIADITLERLGKEHTVGFEKKITDEVVASVNSSPEDVVWICDLGSGYLSEFDRYGLVITDHHVPDPRWRGRQTILDSFGGVQHLNPHTYGIDGSYEVCGAGMTYLLSKEIDPANVDLAYLAVVGAVGDFQDSSNQRLVGPNAAIVGDAVANGDLVVEEDLRFYGRDTRPVNQYLQYASDPSIPGISDNPKGCYELLDSLGIQAKSGGRWRSWSDLSREEHDRAVDAILERLGPDADKAVGEMYRITRYEKGTGMSDAKEFATVLNSCGRYDDAPTGLRVCRGDVGALKVAEENRAEHRKHISTALSYIRDNHLLRERRFIQWFDAGSEVRETVVGIVAGMMLSSSDCRRNIPIIAFADSDDGVKVSARANRDLVDRGLNLSEVMKTAAEIVGGFGGGHTVAAGATIPPEKKEEFLDIVEDLVSSQIE